jgi:hypothetical protein
MHTILFIAWTVAFGLLACVFPFVAVCRGRHFLKTVLIGWVVLEAFVILSVIALPPSVGDLDPADGDPLFDGLFILAMAVLGWIYPLVAASLGYGSRQCWRRLHGRHSLDA